MILTSRYENWHFWGVFSFSLIIISAYITTWDTRAHIREQTIYFYLPHQKKNWFQIAIDISEGIHSVDYVWFSMIKIQVLWHPSIQQFVTWNFNIKLSLCYIDVPPIHVAKRPGIGNWIHTQRTSGTSTIISVWMCLPSYFLTRPIKVL